MATFLFDKIIFGPVQSRRLGSSLGINLLPIDKKICNFNCIYCECGWNSKLGFGEKPVLPSRNEVKDKLISTLKEYNISGKPIDTITFAGNGEPTMHPDFEGIIDDTISCRDIYFPNAEIAVLSNATLIYKPVIFNALKKVDQNILKLDSAFSETVKVLNNPPRNFSVEKTKENLKKFNGDFILQTLFVRGMYNGVYIDNTSDKEMESWLKIVEDLRPKMVMIYTIKRDTPIDTLEAITLSELQKIADKVDRLGIETQISD